MRWWPLALAGAALVVGGAVAFGGASLTEAALALALPSHARKWAPALFAAARKHAAKAGMGWLRFALLYASVIAHETGWGMAPGFEPRGDPAGKGDGGHGHGLPQIDDRTWGAWLAANEWWRPEVQLDKGAEILAAALASFPGNLEAGLATYNAGAGAVRRALAAKKHPDSVTWSGKNGGPGYSVLVKDQLRKLEKRARA